jgi:lysophospholipase L1-like esterase
MAEPELRRRLQPVLDDLVRWGYERIAQVGRENHIPVMALVVPRADLPPTEGKMLARQVQIAAQYGMTVVNLEDAFNGQPPASLRLPPPNNHPSARGHQLLADRLYERLRAIDARGLKLGLAN